ncbi:MAG: hypothetical protein WCW52_02430 [Elusimicrobiales bacterium]|jgi:chromosome segregation ATPase
MTEPIFRYFAFTKRSIKGPFYPKDLAQLPDFGRNTLVCPEAALGQWREAYLESAFRPLLEYAAAPPARPGPALTPMAADDRAVRDLLEKAILKNSQLEAAVKEMKREYAREKKQFEETLKKKDTEIKTLTEGMKRASAARTAQKEHPSWETLYKVLKKRADEKFIEASQTISEKSEEVLRLRAQIRNMADAYEDSKRGLLEKTSGERDKSREELKTLTSELEEKEMAVRTLTDSMRSVLGKNEEFQRIMLDERRDYEAQNTRFCEEIGKLKGESKWKQQEIDRLNSELFEAQNKIKEFESVSEIKNREQEEVYGVIQAKIGLLYGYFENLESRLKYAFRKS